MSALTNTLLVFVPAIGAVVMSYKAVKNMGDLMPKEKRFTAHVIFAVSAGTTIFFFVFYFAQTVGASVDLDFIYPGAKSYPWWLTPASIAWTAFFYNVLSQNTTQLSEVE